MKLSAFSKYHFEQKGDYSQTFIQYKQITHDVARKGDQLRTS